MELFISLFGSRFGISKGDPGEAHLLLDGEPIGTSTTPSGLQFIASGSALHNTFWGGALGGNYNRIESRAKYFMGKAASQTVVLGLIGYEFIATTGDTPFGNAYTAEAAFELDSPVSYQTVTFGNQDKVNVPNGSPGVFSDPIGLFVAADGYLFVRWAAYTAAGGSNILPGGAAPAPTGGQGLVSINTASQIQATGSITANIGGVKIPILLGRPTSPLVSVIIVGDSIAAGTGDTATAAGDIGFVQRGLVSVSGHRVPSHAQSSGGLTFAAVTIDKAFRSRALWRYGTHLVCTLGTNDIAAATSFADMKTYATNLWTAAKNTISDAYGIPLKVAQCTIMPRTTSSDSWATAANQTVVAGFTPTTGVRDLFNAWILTQVGNGILDAVIDVNRYVEDPAHSGKWVTTGAANYPTTDGVHPSLAAHVLAAQAVNAWALTQSPTE